MCCYLPSGRLLVASVRLLVVSCFFQYRDVFCHVSYVVISYWIILVVVAVVVVAAAAVVAVAAVDGVLAL